MNKILVSYDLIRPVRDYGRLHEMLRSVAYAKPLESVWLIKTAYTTEQVRDMFKTVVDGNDKLYVVDITNTSSAWLNLGTAIDQQIKSA